MRRNIPIEKEKRCPLLEKDCLKSECAIYNELLSRCDISLLAYNLFRLSSIEEQRLEVSTKQ